MARNAPDPHYASADPRRAVAAVRQKTFTGPDNEPLWPPVTSTRIDPPISADRRKRQTLEVHQLGVMARATMNLVRRYGAGVSCGSHPTGARFCHRCGWHLRAVDGAE